MKPAENSPAEDAASLPTFEDVADLIAGPDAPPWLAEHFKRWGPSLMLDRFVEAKQPTKSEMKKTLAKVRETASLLRRVLNNSATREFLESNSPGQIKYHGMIDHMLHDLAGWAERAMGSPALSTEAGKTNSGRTKAAPPDACSPKLYCAALIAETWAYFHRSDPPPRNQRAAGAADALWRACGGETKGWGDNPLNRWRYYFQKVQEPRVAAVRRECRRHLVEAGRWSAILAGK